MWQLATTHSVSDSEIPTIDEHLKAGPARSKHKAEQTNTHTHKPEIAAMKAQNFHTTVASRVAAHTYTHTYTHTHTQARNSRNENAEFSHDSCRVASHT